MSKPPLDGIRVADFCWAWAGPYGALQLAHLGAEVIRIESQTRLCPSRMIPPWADNETGINRCGYFNQYNQGKRSLSLDLEKPEGIQLAKQLVAKSDIVIENFAGGVMEKMGLAMRSCARSSPTSSWPRCRATVRPARRRAMCRTGRPRWR